MDPDGLNLGSVVVDEEKGLIILIYSLHFHTSHYGGTMMIQSKTDGLSWSRPRNISSQITVHPFAPGPGFGIQVRGGDHTNCAMMQFVVGSTLGRGLFFLITMSKVCVTHKAPCCVSNLFVFIIILGLYPVLSSVRSSFFMSLHGRNVTTQLKGGWWFVAMAVQRETEFSAYWATITDRLGTMAAWWKASHLIVQREHRTSIQMSARYNCSCFYKHGVNVPG